MLNVILSVCWVWHHCSVCLSGHTVPTGLAAAVPPNGPEIPGGGTHHGTRTFLQVQGTEQNPVLRPGQPVNRVRTLWAPFICHRYLPLVVNKDSVNSLSVIPALSQITYFCSCPSVQHTDAVVHWSRHGLCPKSCTHCHVCYFLNSESHETKPNIRHSRRLIEAGGVTVTSPPIL